MRASSATRFLVGRASQWRVSGWTSTWSSRRPTRSPIFPDLDTRGALFSHECQPETFDRGRPVVHRGPDNVLGPIVDAFAAAGAIPLASSFRDAPALSGTRGAGCRCCLRRLSIESCGWRLLEVSR